MSPYKHLRLESAEGAATITIDRPAQLNALDREAMTELDRAVDEVLEDRSIGGAIITGAGEKSFVAGADINDLAKMTPVTGVELSRRGQGVFRKIELAKKPFIAAVNGFALGGGCELALACHIRVATPAARFGFPEVKLGVIPGYGGTVRLPRVIGKGRALEMILTGEMVGAEDAYRIGLVNHVVAAESLLESAGKMLATILSNAPIALGLAIESATRALETGTEDALALESTFFGFLASTEDLREGTTAFLEKRRPTFRGS